MQKICNKCNLDLELICFNKNSRNKDGYANSCRKCHNNWKRANYTLPHVKQFYRERNSNLKKKTREWVTAYKIKKGCSKCGEKHPACLHFHHKDPKQKLIGISEAVSNGRTLTLIKKEVKKCVILCANCHAKEHWVDS